MMTRAGRLLREFETNEAVLDHIKTGYDYLHGHAKTAIEGAQTHAAPLIAGAKAHATTAMNHVAAAPGHISTFAQNLHPAVAVGAGAAALGVGALAAMRMRKRAQARKAAI